MNSASLESLQVFTGDVSEHTARIYASLDVSNPDLVLSGEVRGPNSPRGVTLPARTVLSNLPGETPLAAGVIPDPCFWTTDQPATYEARLQLHLDGEQIGETTRQVAIRPLGANDRSLYFAGRRWVMRAIQPELTAISRLPFYRETESTIVVADFEGDFVSEACENGVRILLDLRRSEAVNAGLRQAVLNPAVIGAVLPAEAQDALDPRKFARNLLLVCEVVEPSRCPDWAQVVLLPSAGLEESIRTFADRAVIVYREREPDADDASMRAAADQLQASLAATGQYAGYAILTP